MIRSSIENTNGQNATERGKNYRIVFEQKGHEAMKTGTTVDSWNATEVATCPYVYAPTSIAVENPKASVATEGWEAQLYMGDVEATWINGYANAPTNAGSKMVVTLKSSANTTYATATAFGQETAGATTNYQALVGGLTMSAADVTDMTTVDDSTAKQTNPGNAGDQYVFASFEAPAGIFGKDKLSLVSDACPVAEPVAVVAGLNESASDAEDMIATFSTLKYNGTAYLFASGIEGNQAEQVEALKDNIKNQTGVIGMAPVTRGDASVTFDEVLDGVNDTTYGDYYAVVVVPDTDVYTTGVGFGNVRQEIAAYVLDSYTGLSSTDGGKITAVDQFGEAYEGTVTGLAAGDMTARGTNVGNGTLTVATFDNSTAGVVAVTFAATSTAIKNTTDPTTGHVYAASGDVFTMQLTTGQTFCAKVNTVNTYNKTADPEAPDTVAATWTCWIQ